LLYPAEFGSGSIPAIITPRVMLERMLEGGYYFRNALLLKQYPTLRFPPRERLVLSPTSSFQIA